MPDQEKTVSEAHGLRHAGIQSRQINFVASHVVFESLSEFLDTISIPGPAQDDPLPRILNGYPSVVPEVFYNGRPRYQERLISFSRPMPEFDRKVPCPPGLREEIRYCVHLVDIILIGMKMLGKVESSYP